MERVWDAGREYEARFYAFGGEENDYSKLDMAEGYYQIDTCFGNAKN